MSSRIETWKISLRKIDSNVIFLIRIKKSFLKMFSEHAPYSFYTNNIHIKINDIFILLCVFHFLLTQKAISIAHVCIQQDFYRRWKLRFISFCIHQASYARFIGGIIRFPSKRSIVLHWLFQYLKDLKGYWL